MLTQRQAVGEVSQAQPWLCKAYHLTCKVTFATIMVWVSPAVTVDTMASVLAATLYVSPNANTEHVVANGDTDNNNDDVTYSHSTRWARYAIARARPDCSGRTTTARHRMGRSGCRPARAAPMTGHMQ